VKRPIRRAAGAAFLAMSCLPSGALAQSGEVPVQGEAAPPQAATAGQPVEMVVTGERESKAAQLQQSAEAVHVVETRRARQQSADLGEVLARSQGIGLRREGGLGSSSRFSLNGLTDDQVRFFLDGVPLELAGFPFEIANVPVNLIDRVEIFRGVVPIRFGADALGGVVNLVTPQQRRSYFAGSYQIGSFGTQRVTLDGRLRDADSGLFVAHTAFLDVAKNDYDVQVDLPDERGRTTKTDVPRFHDGYRAFGGTLEAGVTDKPWAKRLSLTGFASSKDKQLQNDLYMRIPYGEVTYGESIYGATARYEVSPAPAWKLEALANYSHRIIEFRDVGSYKYDWLGRRVAMLIRPGETGNRSDSTLWQNTVFGRAVLSWDLAPAHVLRAAITPTFTSRYGEERARMADEPDRLAPTRSLFTLVTGLEYEINLWDERVSNVAFVKDYVYAAHTFAYPTGGAELMERNGSKHKLGAGDSLRVRITPWLYAKASYEYATRLPRADELLGDGRLVQANPELEPEVSHNGNLGAQLEWKRTPAGSFMLDVNGFVRDSDRLILLNGSSETARFENVYRARSLGLENAASWTSPGKLVALDGSLTWLDLRNTSSAGQFKSLEGDRLPNRPYLYGSWGARVHLAGIPTEEDSIEPFYYGRYVHAFFLGWESLGGSSKLTVPDQVAHDLGVTWIVTRDFATLSASLELQNITDARLYDNFGVQRPGRAFYAKVTATLP
jgi:outer membrane cobalamin receptor